MNDLTQSHLAVTNPSRFRPGPKTIVVIIVVIALLLGTRLLAAHFMGGAKEAHAEEAPSLPVGTFRPTKTQLEALKIAPIRSMSFRSEQITDGTIANNDDTVTPVFSPYSGHVAKLYAKLGDQVKKGTPLMAVEASEFVQGQNDLVAAVAVLNTARAQVTLTQAAENRQHELFLAKAGAMKDWLQSQADLAAAQSNLRSAEIALGAVRNRLRILGKSDQEISVLETLPPAQKMNPEALVVAPIAGTVIQRQVGVGQFIQSAAAGASNPVYSIANLSTVWMIANVREADASLLHLGQAVEVQVLAWPNRVFKAKVAWIAPAVDPNTHRLPVRAEVDNRDDALKPMMFGSFHIITGDAVSALGVPQSAVVYEGPSAHVFVARNDGLLALREIRTGLTSGDMVEVSEGLAAGEKVVTAGALFIDRAAESK